MPNLTTFQQLKTAAKYLCTKGTTLEGMDYVLNRISNTQIMNDIIVRRGELQRYLDQFSARRIKSDDFSIAVNDITYHFLSILDSINLSDLRDDIDVQEAPPIGGFEANILTICEREERRVELETFFHNFHFRKVICITALDWEEVEIELKKINKDRTPKFIPLITVFDNHHLSHCPDRDAFDKLTTPEQVDIANQIDFMKSCIRKELSPYYLHYGEAFYFLNLDNNRDLIHAANSRFALIARTKELLDYIAAYRNEKPMSDSPHHLSDDAKKME